MENIIEKIGLIVFGIVLGWLLNILYQNRLEKRKRGERKEEKDDTLLDDILEQISEIVQYRRGGTTYQSVTKWRSKIYQLSLDFQSGKYDDILPKIKVFGEKYKDSIPPAGARSEVMAKHKKFWEEVAELQSMIERRKKGNEKNCNH